MTKSEDISPIIPLNLGSSAQNFGLSSEEFNVMVGHLMNGSDELFEHVFLTHFEECRSFIYGKYDMSYETSYDITMDTLIEFRLKLIQGKISYGNTRYLFTRMACNNFVASMRQDQKVREILFESKIEDETYEEHILTLEAAWKKLDESEKKILKSYYYDGLPLKDIANDLQIPDATLRKKKQRAMDRLREIFFSFKHL